MYIKTYFYSVFIPLFILLIPVFIQAQTNDMARSGPGGIYLFLGKNIPSGKNSAVYHIERREENNSWKPLTELKSPATAADFNAKYLQCLALFPETVKESNDNLAKLYEKGYRSGTIDSVGGWHASYPLRMAFGIIFYDTEVKKGKKYQYKVTEITSAGAQVNLYLSNSVGYGEQVSFDPVTVKSIYIDDKSLLIKWTSVGGNPAKSFNVFKFADTKPVKADGITGKYLVRDTTTYIYYDSSIRFTPDQEIQYFLSPADILGNRGIASQIAVVRNDNYSRAVFKDLKAIKLSETLGIKLSWRFTLPQTLKCFNIYKSLQPDKGFERLASLTPKDTLFVDQAISADKVYYYYLTAESKTPSEPKRSNTVFSVSYDPAVPFAPVISGGFATEKGIKLIVDITDINVAGVRIYRNNGKSDTLNLVSGLVRKSDSARIVFIDSSGILSSKLTYKYKVRAESSSYILSDFSNEVTVRPFNNQAPANPLSFTAYEENGKVYLSWESMQPADPELRGYVISRREENSDSKNLKPFAILKGAPVPFESNFLTDSAVSPGKVYTYMVESVNYDAKKSLRGSVVTVSLQPDLPIPPAGLSAQSVAEGVRLEWGETIYEGLLSYKLYRYQRGSAPVLLKSTGAGITEYTDFTALKDQLYFYYLTTVNKSGLESIPSAETGIRP